MARFVELTDDMIRQAKRTGSSIRELPQGLRIHFTWCAGQKTLALSRPAAKPSDAEIRLCRTCFIVPDTARRTDTDTEVEYRWET